MQEIKAPNGFLGITTRPSIFLAGSIEMGDAPDWQRQVVEGLKDRECLILNPRRDDWDSSWVQSINNPQFREQVEWELVALECADVVLFHLSPGTKSPITLLELGIFYEKAIVHCPEGFWRKGNVDIVCRHFDVRQAASLAEAIKMCVGKTEETP